MGSDSAGFWSVGTPGAGGDVESEFDACYAGGSSEFPMKEISDAASLGGTNLRWEKTVVSGSLTL